jgi:FkbM family methyltransferase
MRDLLQNMLQKLGFHITSTENYLSLLFAKRAQKLFLILNSLRSVDFKEAYLYLENSKAQELQDLFVLALLDFKKNGFFVEFGAVDGIYLSNTHLLEKSFGWRGILSEPIRSMKELIEFNRSCHVNSNCIWSVSGSFISFSETRNPILSTATSFVGSDTHKRFRKIRSSYSVETLSLMDLLDYFEAPKIIDYLSIDTEGSEFKILDSFDFTKYRFHIITVEHNFTSNREKIYDLLQRNGYKRILTNLSYVDDWYISETLYQEKFI